MSYQALVVKIASTHPIKGKDRIVRAVAQNHNLVVSADMKPGDVGVLFPGGGQLSQTFYENNKDSLRFVDPVKRRIYTQSFGGVRSEGLFVPFSYFKYTGFDLASWKVGTQFTSIGDHEICRKYVSPRTSQIHTRGRTYKQQRETPFFLMHYDTPQFAWADGSTFSFPGDSIYITEKLHGTSQRFGLAKVEKPLSRAQKIVSRFIPWPFQTEEYVYLTGTRRVILWDQESAGFYGNNDFRFQVQKNLEGQLMPGETIYFEVVGYSGQRPIMPSVQLSKQNGTHKRLMSKYRTSRMDYSYGCLPGTCKMYVYRITITTLAGHPVELSYHQMRDRCQDLGIDPCPHIDTVLHQEDGLLIGGSIEARSFEEFFDQLDGLSQGPSLLDNRHIREGLCIWVEGRRGIQVYKHKSFDFKVLEDIVKDDDSSVDIEEIEG